MEDRFQNSTCTFGDFSSFCDPTSILIEFPPDFIQNLQVQHQILTNSSFSNLTFLIGIRSSSFEVKEEKELIFVNNSIPFDNKIKGWNDELWLKSFLIKGLEIIGISVKRNDELKNEGEDNEIISKIVSKISDYFINQTPFIVLFLSSKTIENSSKTYIVQQNSKSTYINQVSPSFQLDSSKKFLENLFLFKTHISFSIPIIFRETEFKKTLNLQIVNWITSFKLEDIRIQMGKSKKVYSFKESDSQDFQPFFSENNPKICVTNSNQFFSFIEVISASVYKILSSDTNSVSPVIKFSQTGKNCKLANPSFEISIIFYLHKKSPLNLAFKYIYETTIYQLQFMNCQMTEELIDRKMTSFHFLPQNYPHHFTIIYPISTNATSEDYLLEYRKNIHSRLIFPMDRPIIRITNSLNFLNTKFNNSKRIVDVHKFVAPTALSKKEFFKKIFSLSRKMVVNESKQYLVQGSYEYYHYMQEGFNDNGWGCAYRSLQTIFSWFKLQRYTNLEIPSILEIQRTLAKLGDKPDSFVNSKQWIGAIEISLCLDHLLGVTSNIMHLSSGSELASKGRELQLHFQTHGTPVMIGGGVLAYTLLGIDFNEKTGDIRFLILDPHYIGSEDPKIIKEKGWCGWKSVELFRRDSFYNLCLPQRLQQI